MAKQDIKRTKEINEKCPIFTSSLLMGFSAGLKCQHLPILFRVYMFLILVVSSPFLRPLISTLNI